MNDNNIIRVPAQRIRHQRFTAPPRRALYWAYGSNLNFAHMNRRCPAAEPVADLTVKHAALVFRGVADVTDRRGSSVPGGLWRITRECERSLDSYEGVSSRAYLKRFFTVVLPNGQWEDVLFYQMSAKHGVMPPTESYLATILRGYHDFSLPVAVLDAALQEAWNEKQVTRYLRERHVRRGSPALASARYLERQYFTLDEDDLKEAGAL